MELLKPKEYNEILEDFEKLSVQKRCSVLKNIKKTDILRQFVPKSGIKLFRFKFWGETGDFWLIKNFTNKHVILENTIHKVERKVQYRYLFSSYYPIQPNDIKKQIKEFEHDIVKLKNILNQIS